jgi:integrase
MSRKAKGPRLRIRERAGREAIWTIHDGESRVSTGIVVGPHEREDRPSAEAQLALAEYLQAKHDPKADKGKVAREDVLIADILSSYVRAKVEAMPEGTPPGKVNAFRRKFHLLGQFFGTRKLGELTGQLCRDYAKGRNSPSSARRELEDFRAAIGAYFSDDPIKMRFNIPMPPKGQARERYLTYEEAAKLLMACWRRTLVMPQYGGKRPMARHVARFILVALYTGSRASRICSASLVATEGRGFVDLERGVFYRRPPGTRETNKRAPPVRIPDRLLAHIRRWHRLGLCKDFVVEWEGQPVATVGQVFRRIADGLGMHDVSPHILRHTAITWAMWNGVSMRDASEYFGVSEALIRSTYGHHHPEHSKAVGEALTRRERSRVKPDPRRSGSGMGPEMTATSGKVGV